MTSLVALSLLLAAPADAAAGAVSMALVVPGARVEVLDLRLVPGHPCHAERAEALRTISGSGEVPVRLAGKGEDGRNCEAYAWARIRVVSSGLVLTRAVASGEPLQDALTHGDVELRVGHPTPLTELPSGGRAAHALLAGAPLLPSDVREGPLPGEPITVVVRTGTLELTQTGHVLPCPKGRACALLPGGRRVEGRLEDGQLLLEAP